MEEAQGERVASADEVRPGIVGLGHVPRARDGRVQGRHQPVTSWDSMITPAALGVV